MDLIRIYYILVLAFSAASTAGVCVFVKVISNFVDRRFLPPAS